MRKNRGYTLVEVVIIMVIMAVLSTAALVSIGIIRQAKRSASVNTLNNQISSCLIRTKALSDAFNGTSEPFCMLIKKNSAGAYVVMMGYNDGSNVKNQAGTSGTVLNPDTSSTEAVLVKDIKKIVYTDTDGNELATGQDMIIQFIKTDGSVQKGAGTYDIYIKGSGTNGELYATIYLEKSTGNHYVKFR